MAVTTRPPQTPVRPRSIAERPRRWPKRVLAALVVMLLIAVAGSWAWLVRYQPLVGGGTGSYIVTPARLQTGSSSVEGYLDGSFSQVQMRLVTGTKYRFEFPLWNKGRLPVTITGLSEASEGAPGDTVRLRLAGTTSMTAHLANKPSTAPFVPVTLAPGEGIEVFVDVRIDANAYEGGAVVGINTLVVNYTVLRFLHRDATVFLGMSVQFCKPRCDSNA